MWCMCWYSSAFASYFMCLHSLLILLKGGRGSYLSLIARHTSVSTSVDALHTVKTTLDDPTGSLENWSKGDPCTSNWTGVLCSDRVASDGFYHIKKLQLLNMNLSGNLAPELGELSHLEILNFMWNRITGAIPKEIGKLSSLKILVLNGNRLSGSLPDELGYLSNMNRLQLDENSLSGPIPKSFANMKSIKHFHLNNNLFSGQLPPELSRINSLIHLLMDNNNLSGILPPQYSALSKLQILQLDNNNFVGAEVPESYQNLPALVKLSLRNCSLGGALPDLSQMPSLSYIDLSWNDLTGSLPSNKLSDNITTINLSHNKLSGPLPESFSFLPSLQMLSLENNSLNGSVPAGLWDKSLSSSDSLSIDLRYNLLSNISGALNPPHNVTLRLQGNPVCDASIQRINDFCDSDAGGNLTTDGVTSSAACSDATCPVEHNFEPIPDFPTCICAAPIRIGYRLKSPTFTYFPPYISAFVSYITNALNMEPYQLFIESYAMEAAPRLRMNLKLFPNINASNGSHKFNDSELRWISSMYHGWDFPSSELFGPYELLNFTLLGPYSSADLQSGNDFPIPAMIGVIICAITAFVGIVAAIILILRKSNRCPRLLRRFMPKHTSIKIDGVKEFTYHDMSRGTNNFNSATQVGEGGYGKVYRGILPDDTVVAVKRAQEGTFQGTREFLTEIHLLSRLHHRNLVSLVGYCSEHGEQMLVYEFMPNGTLQDWLSGKLKKTLGYTTRLSIALGAAKGILYLHREANPPVYHRDIKASNILLDSNMIAKVADFGLSRLAPSLDDKDDVPGGHVSAVKGTPGYLDPEYSLTRKMTDKSDVYSLGVVFLELLTSLPPILNGKNLVREVNMAHKSGSLFDFIDCRMILPSWECVERFMDLARGCCHNKPDKRPSMSDVVRELENIIQMLPENTNNMPNTTLVQLTRTNFCVRRSHSTN